jgi:hypothetical protein
MTNHLEEARKHLANLHLQVVTQDPQEEFSSLELHHRLAEGDDKIGLQLDSIGHALISIAESLELLVARSDPMAAWPRIGIKMEKP